VPCYGRARQSTVRGANPCRSLRRSPLAGWPLSRCARDASAAPGPDAYTFVVHPPWGNRCFKLGYCRHGGDGRGVPTSTGGFRRTPLVDAPRSRVTYRIVTRTLSSDALLVPARSAPWTGSASEGASAIPRPTELCQPEVMLASDSWHARRPAARPTFLAWVRWPECPLYGPFPMASQRLQSPVQRPYNLECLIPLQVVPTPLFAVARLLARRHVRRSW
jgi:hypothetical protein